MKKFPAEVVNYQIVAKPYGTVAIIKLEVPEGEVAKSYFVGGLVDNFADFSVDNVHKPTEDIEE